MTIDRKRLKGFVTRIQGLEGEKRDLGADIKDVYAEAKAAGFNVRAIRRIIADQRLAQHKREQLENDIDLYVHAMGWAETPLGKLADEAEAKAAAEAAAASGKGKKERKRGKPAKQLTGPKAPKPPLMLPSPDHFEDRLD